MSQQALPWDTTPKKGKAKKESSFWKSFQSKAKALRPKWRLTRLESWASLGVPDVLGCDEQGRFFLIELKSVTGNAVRLSPHQISFLTTHQHAPVYCLVHQTHRNGESLYLYPGAAAIDLAQDGLATEPLLRLDKERSSPWDDLFLALAQ